MGIPTKEMMDAHEGRHRESLVYEVEVLRARVKQLEWKLQRAERKYKLCLGDLYEHLSERDAALDALHALAEWLDAVKMELERKAPFGRQGGGNIFESGRRSAANLLRGGWDATAGEE